MLARWCALAAIAEATGESVPIGLRVHPGPSHLRYSFADRPVADWCPQHASRLTLYPVTEADVVGVMGEAAGREVWSHRQESWMVAGYGLFHTSLVFVFHSLHHAALRYDQLWVFEDDVAWTGNLFDYMRLFAERPEDLLAGELMRNTVGDYWHWSRMQSADGWAGGDGAAIARTMMFAQRLSAPLLDLLVDHCRRGHWAHDEWFAATVCVRPEHHLGTHFRRRNCTAWDAWHLSGEFELGLLPVYSPVMWGPSYDEAVWNASAWHAAVAADAAGGDAPLRLYHPVKF